jgi:uncharacterized membrane protein HdeD (DUF308 family)
MALTALQSREERFHPLVDLVSELASRDEPRKRIAGLGSGLDIHYSVAWRAASCRRISVLMRLDRADLFIHDLSTAALAREELTRVPPRSSARASLARCRSSVARRVVACDTCSTASIDGRSGTMSERAGERAAEIGVDPAELRRFWSEQVKTHYKLLLGIGAVLVLTGIFSILVPIVVSVSVAILAGWILLVGGVVQFAHILRQTAGWDRVWRLLLALVTAIAGLSLLLFPLSGTITITFVLVVWFWVSGATKIGAWWRMRGVEGSWMLGLNGLVSVVLGALIWADLPSSAAWAVGLLVGIELLLYGMSLISAGLEGRRLAHG